MEEALFVSDIKNLKYWESKYSRLYFGNEFCERLIPAPEELKTVMEFVEKHKLEFTFVSCFVTGMGLEKMRAILGMLEKSAPGSELIVNDWGVFRMSRTFNLRPVLGRLLSKQKRDPRILNFINKLSGPLVADLKEASINSYFVKFLEESRITRVEIDNLLQGIQIDKDIFQSLSLSLYSPYGYITTTRLCHFCAVNDKGMVGVFPCQRQCRGFAPVLMKHKTMPVPLILKGNTLFFQNPRLPQGLAEHNIDRIVYQPEIPL